MRFEFQNLSPTEDSFLTIENCASDLFPEGGAISEWHRSYVKNHKRRIALDLDIVKERVKTGAEILEFGSVPLLLTTALASSNYRVTGIDIAPERYKSAIEERKIKIIKCDVENEKLPLEDNSFDAVVFNELFEHLRINPVFTLSEVLRVMKPGGVLMLSSPNLRSLNGIYNFFVRNRAYSCSGDIYAEYKKMEMLGHMGHVREYTTTEVIEFLGNIGFDVTSVIYRGGFDSMVKHFITMLVPSLRPFVSYISIKPMPY